MNIEHRKKRHIRVRKYLSGTKERPRLAVFRSSKHIYAQIIDDGLGKTIVSASDVKISVLKWKKLTKQASNWQKKL